MTVTFPVMLFVPEDPAVRPPESGASAAADRSKVEVANVPSTVRVPAIVRLDAAARLMPAFTVRLFNAWGALTVPPVVAATRVELPALNVPRELSNDWKLTDDPFAVRLPWLEREIVPAAVMGRFPAEVVRIVSPVGLAAVFWIVRLPARLRPRADIVYVTPEAAVVSNTRLANSEPLRLDPANVMVCADALLNVTVAVPANQEADVDASVHDPPTVQDSEPKET